LRFGASKQDSKQDTFNDQHSTTKLLLHLPFFDYKAAIFFLSDHPHSFVLQNVPTTKAKANQSSFLLPILASFSQLITQPSHIFALSERLID